MSHTKPIAALTAALLLAATGPARALSGDREAACGAILCLVGGSGVAACAPYLARYFAIDAANPAALFDRRLDFLNLCPAPDLPGDMRATIARYGATCQPTRLASYLNGQLESCRMRTDDSGDDCEPTGNEWQICAAFYDRDYTAYDPPRLSGRCRLERDDDGYRTERCSRSWTPAPARALPLPQGSPRSDFAPTLFAPATD